MIEELTRCEKDENVTTTYSLVAPISTFSFFEHYDVDVWGGEIALEIIG